MRARRAGLRKAGLAVVLSFCGACASEPSAVTVATGEASSVSPVGRPSAVDDPSGPSAVVDDPSGSVRPPAQPPSGQASTTVALPGPFRTITVHLTRADGTTFDWCLLLADTEPRREQGLMGVTDLAGYAGMLFSFGADQRAEFWMKDTIMPLSIAFFRADGAFVSAADMPPCAPDASAVCPLYPAVAPYANAIETTLGALTAAGVTSGATLTLGEPGCRPG